MSKDQDKKANPCGESKSQLEEIPVRIIVINDFTKEKVSYSTSVTERGLMFGALNNLQDTNKDFKFTYTVHKHKGISLESVNGVAGSDEDKTHWHLSSEKGGVTTPLKVEIGNYRPEKNENLILRFTTKCGSCCPAVGNWTCHTGNAGLNPGPVCSTSECP